MASPVIDVHTHSYSKPWLELLKRHAAPRYTVREVRGGREAIHFDGAPFNTLLPEFFDFDERIRAMNRHGVDICIVSLAAPSVYWGSVEVSLAAARAMNDEFAQAQTAFPDRIRWFATLPWQYPEQAVAELGRAVSMGAAGVLVLANVAERSLTDPLFAPVWRAIDERALPVLVHPTAPPAVGRLDLARYQLTVPIGFMFDTTMALGRMIFDGFFDRYARLKIIGAHAGGALPFLISRFDRCYEKIGPARETLTVPPSAYMDRLYLDGVVYSPQALAMAVEVVGEANVMYGSDYPHNISDMPGCLKRVNDLPGEQKEKVRGLNARRAFGL